MDNPQEPPGPDPTPARKPFMSRSKLMSPYWIFHTAVSEAAGVRVCEDTTFARLTTLRVGGPVGILLDCPNEVALLAAFVFSQQNDISTLVLGGGSNLLVSDDGWSGAVLRLTGRRLKITDDVVSAEAGLSWDELVQATVEAGLGGLECLSGIPGTVGASLKQNIGAYGAQLSDTLLEASLMDRETATRRWVPLSELGLGYRTSAIRHDQSQAVLGLSLKLNSDGLSAPIRHRELALALGISEGQRAWGRDVREAVLALRARKGMLLDEADHDTWCAGSFFVNPQLTAAQAARLFPDSARPEGMPWYPGPAGGVKLSAAWLIERAGFAKGHPDEGAPARLSTKHALAITNRGTATARDLLGLARQVRAGVHEAFGVLLEPEPVLLGCVL